MSLSTTSDKSRFYTNMEIMSSLSNGLLKILSFILCILNNSIVYIISMKWCGKSQYCQACSKDNDAVVS